MRWLAFVAMILTCWAVADAPAGWPRRPHPWHGSYPYPQLYSRLHYWTPSAYTLKYYLHRPAYRQYTPVYKGHLDRLHFVAPAEEYVPEASPWVVPPAESAPVPATPAAGEYPPR